MCYIYFMSKVKMTALLGVSLLGLYFSAAAAQAGVIGSATPESLKPLLEEAGYLVVLDNSGKSPFLEVQNADKELLFYVDFFNCQAAVCANALANISYDAKDFKKAPDLSSINTWNQDYTSQAYLDDEGSPHLVSTYTLSGGFTSDNFIAWIKAYEDEDNQFYDALNK